MLRSAEEPDNRVLPSRLDAGMSRRVWEKFPRWADPGPPAVFGDRRPLERTGREAGSPRRGNLLCRAGFHLGRAVTNLGPVLAADFRDGLEQLRGGRVAPLARLGEQIQQQRLVLDQRLGQL